MHRSLLALPVVLLVVACGSSSGKDEPVTSPPSDPVVFDASDATKADVGVAKWGFTSDPSATVFHGYDANNVQLVELRQSLSPVDKDTARIAVTMTGAATASETIDFAAKAADGGGATITMQVVENSFVDGSAASRLLAHLEVDAKTQPMATGSGSLTQSHPLDAPLVSHSCDTVTPCINQMIDARTAATSLSGSCSVLKLVGLPLLSAAIGAGAGGLITLETGPGAIVGALAGAVGGGLSTAASNAISCAQASSSASTTAQALKTCQQQAASCGK